MAEGDDMGSLFEGMVLFTPSPTPSASDHPPPDSPDATSSVPLDENLFSDLTIVAPSPPTDETSKPPEAPPVSSSLSRQISTRKKKRAAGLRIGYGREKDGLAPLSLEDFPESSQVPVEVVKDEDLDSATCSGGGKEEPVQPQPVIVSGGGSMIELRLEEIRSGIKERLEHAREAVALASAARKHAIKRRRKAAENLSQASARHRELEKELEEACESEEFEKAESVSESLASAERDKDLLVDVLREAEAEYDTVDSRMLEALKHQIEVEEEAASLLHNFAEDASNDADSAFQNAKEVSAKQMESCISSTEHLELHRMELEIESYLIEEARSDLSTSIEHSMEGDRKEMDLLNMKREILQDDLEKLLALVRQKEAEISENDFKIEALEKRISGVKSGFNEVQSGLDAKVNDLQSALKQVELQKDILSKSSEETKHLLHLEETKGAKIKGTLRISRNEANVFQEAVALRQGLLQVTSDFMQDKVRLTDIEESLSRNLHSLRQELSSARASLQELSSSKSSIQQELGSQKQRLFFIDKRVPELEGEKKVAASARNFKEAARISTEMKTLSLEKEELTIRTDNAVLELKKLDEQISDTIKRIQETEVMISSKEKESAIATYQRLMLNAAVATAERSAALELGDDEEAAVLSTEAEASVAEARKLELLYNFSNEDVDNLTKHFVPVELISKLGNKQLAELLDSLHISSK